MKKFRFHHCSEKLKGAFKQWGAHVFFTPPIQGIPPAIPAPFTAKESRTWCGMNSLNCCHSFVIGSRGHIRAAAGKWAELENMFTGCGLMNGGNTA